MENAFPVEGTVFDARVCALLTVEGLDAEPGIAVVGGGAGVPQLAWQRTLLVARLQVGRREVEEFMMDAIRNIRGPAIR